MMLSPQEKITNIQASIAVIMTIVGVGIITLPRVSAEAVQTPDIWITVAISGAIAMFAAFFVVKLSQMYPNETFYQFSQHVIGKFFGYMVNFVFILYFTLLAGFEVRTMGEVIRSYLLDKTPIEATIFVFMSVAVYVVLAGLNPILKLFELYFPVILIFFLFIFLLSLTNFDINNIRPVLGEGIPPVLKGVKPNSLSYIGFEIMFVLTACMQKPQKALMTTFIGIGFTISLYVFILIFVIGALTVEEVRLLTFPTMELVKSIEIKGFFLERFETFFIILWVITTFTTFIMAFYLASLGMAQIFHKKRKHFVYGLLPFIYLSAMYPHDINGVFKYGDYVGNMAIFVAGILPVLLWSIASIRKKFQNKKGRKQ
ncbi:GerAB/ArcD/ProY family transporter [Bacillus sp. FJAT-47783]|uniref:GerAB/ArcD/ProY family transporter n=1 Tax=Bacillus sp. FJAT-47783 TaxID=2922712 RepID=UPI001FAC9C9A|nr:GerAB/ArcD/ProY family transporter [Bacillus sp. FJAT-47783]